MKSGAGQHAGKSPRIRTFKTKKHWDSYTIYNKAVIKVTHFAVFTEHKRFVRRGKYKAKNFSTHIIVRMADE